jgi:hypothetical protein
MDAVESAWLDALVARHTAALTRPELLKAIRALSARYVERRQDLPGRSPLDSAGKRAAFALFYAPLHYFTTQLIVRELPVRHAISTIIDLGCGTGTASAAWARSLDVAPALRGVDRHPWAIDEASWTWRSFGLDGRARRGDLVEEVRRLTPPRRAPDLRTTAILCAWSVNELETAARDALLPLLLAAVDRGATVLVVEPIARSATPWWDAWSAAVTSAGGRTDNWRFPAELPAPLADLDEAAGFARNILSVKTLCVTR